MTFKQIELDTLYEQPHIFFFFSLICCFVFVYSFSIWWLKPTKWEVWKKCNDGHMRFSLVTWYQMHPYVFLIWNILPLKTLIGTTTTTFKILIWCANNTLSQGEIAKWNKKNSLYEFKNISWNQLTFWFYGFQCHYQHFPVKSLFLQIHSVENSSKPRSLFLWENQQFFVSSNQRFY